MAGGWRRIDGLDLDAFTLARDQTHRGVQWLARIARSFAPPSLDDSATAVEWSEEPPAADVPVDDRPLAAPAFRLFAPFPVDVPVIGRQLTAAYAPLGNRVWIGRPDRVAETIALDRRDDDAVEAQIRTLLSRLGADAERFAMDLPYADELPDAVSEIAPPDGVERLMDAFANAHATLSTIAERAAGAGPLRVWPHHFDMATLIALEPGGATDGTNRSVGVGFFPGDDADAPYFYVTPWPYPSKDALPPAPSGLTWRTDAVTALVTPALDLMASRSGEGLLLSALDDGIAMCRRLLRAPALA